MIILFLNLGGGEIMLVLLVVLLFFGSKSIPDLARGLGKGLREIREATDNIKREIEIGSNQVTNNQNTSNDSNSKSIEEIIKENPKDNDQTIESPAKPMDQQLD